MLMLQYKNFVLKCSYSMFFVLFFSTIASATITLEDCVQQSLENSEKISIADLEVLIEKDTLRERWSLALPKLSAHADIIAAGNTSSFYKNRKIFNAKVSLIVPIYDFGKTSNTIRAHKKIYEASTFSNSRVKQELVFAVHQIYYQLLEAKKIASIISESLGTLEEQLRVANDMLSHGLLHRNNVLLIEVQLAQREQDAIHTKQNIDLTLEKLSRITSIPLEDLAEIEEPKWIPWKGNFDDIVSDVISSHPDLLALELHIQSATYGYKAEKSTRLPEIYAFSDYSTTNAYALPYTHGMSVGVGVQWNLYSGGATSARIERQNKRRIELQRRFEGVYKDIILGVKSAYLQVERAADRIPIAQKGIGLAKQALQVTQDQFKEGLVTIYDVLLDEKNLAEAKSNYYQGLYDFHRAHAELIYISGKGIPK
jgi:outer membrane protein